MTVAAMPSLSSLSSLERLTAAAERRHCSTVCRAESSGPEPLLLLGLVVDMGPHGGICHVRWASSTRARRTRAPRESPVAERSGAKRCGASTRTT